VATTEERIIAIIQGVVNESGRESGLITSQSSMGNPRAWDSMVFVEVFETIASEFNLDLSDDDAVHFMSVTDIVSFIQDQ
jgi:acyl carrier protein